MFNIRKSFSTKLTLGILMMAVVIFALSSSSSASISLPCALSSLSGQPSGLFVLVHLQLEIEQ